MKSTIIEIKNNSFANSLRNRLFELRAKNSNSSEIDAFINLFQQTLKADFNVESNKFLDD